ncbi:hypothetical protein ACFOGI_02940 [Virgibacillus xinjiangensis]|uniref:Uncharacterized protein n=1 Tax=Virgibacillus xinjiangensis TaxID=393090 RepID=A0ABV7CSH3_9BACI
MEHIRIVSNYLESIFKDDSSDVQVRDYPYRSYGKKIIDQQGDYMIIYYHEELSHFVYTFKGTEDIFFSLHLIKGNTTIY